MKQFLDLGGSDASSAGPGSGFEGMLEGMMGQLMSKDVLYEPLIDLSKKVCAYLYP
jgi:peroxin-19